MKKKLIVISAVVVILLIAFLIRENIMLKGQINENDVSSIPKKNHDMLSMMLETEAGSGNYEMTTASSWPTEGYIFNPELSKCENGGELSWDNEKKVVLMSGNKSDKCYVYFDVYVKPQVLADYVKSLYVSNNGENGIYYHDASLANGAGDNSYRFSGANPNNYVCFGSTQSPCPADNLYRIIGVFGDKVKLIKATSAKKNMLGTDGTYDANYPERYRWSSLSSCPSTTAYVEDNYNNIVYMAKKNEIAAKPIIYGCNKWNYSQLNTRNLNVNFLQTFSQKYISQISDATWQVDSSKTKIGLMSYQDYQFAFSPNYWDLSYTIDYKNSNWLYNFNDLCSHTITPINSNEHLVYTIINDDFYDAEFALSRGNGGKLYENGSVAACAIYPSFYLYSDVTYKSGAGTKIDPIILGD